MDGLNESESSFAGRSFDARPLEKAGSDGPKTGPDIAILTAAVPTSSQTHLSPATVGIFHISINAMEVPTIGDP